MLLLDDDIYYETKNFVRGEQKRSPLLIEFSDWLRSTFSVELLNFQFDNIPYTNRLRLGLILKNTADWQTLRNPYYWANRPPEPLTPDQQIAQEFEKLALRHEFSHPSKLKDLFISYNDFSEEAKFEARAKAGKEIEKRIEAEFPIVWHVEGLLAYSVIFFGTNANILEFERNGISSRIADTYYAILKQYDDLNYFTRENIGLTFDSKENLDINYEGNLFYYSKAH